jgi:hypothetical protein
MNHPRFFLLYTSALFVIWIGCLGYLAVTHAHWKEDLTERVLSRPQFLISQLDIIAKLDSPNDSEITVGKVVHNRTGKDIDPGQQLNIKNLSECEGWKVPGEYILPLVKADAEGKTYRVAEVPRSPGSKTLPPGIYELRIYKLTPETSAQLNQVDKSVKE